MLSPDIENKIKSCALEFNVKAVGFLDLPWRKGRSLRILTWLLKACRQISFLNFMRAFLWRFPSPLILLTFPRIHQ